MLSETAYSYNQNVADEGRKITPPIQEHDTGWLRGFAGDKFTEHMRMKAR